MENLQSKNFMSYIETASKLSRKENFGTFCHKKSQAGRVIKASKRKLLTVDQFNKCSFYFEHARPIEGVQHNDFESSVIFAQVVYCSIIL